MAIVATWDAVFERSCRAQVERLCAAGSSADRDRAWQALLTAVAPHIERWAATSPALRRVGLTGEDEPRAVLVDVIERMSDRDFANLRAAGALEHRVPGRHDRHDIICVATIA